MKQVLILSVFMFFSLIGCQNSSTQETQANTTTKKVEKKPEVTEKPQMQGQRPPRTYKVVLENENKAEVTTLNEKGLNDNLGKIKGFGYREFTKTAETDNAVTYKGGHGTTIFFKTKKADISKAKMIASRNGTPPVLQINGKKLLGNTKNAKTQIGSIVVEEHGKVREIIPHYFEHLINPNLKNLRVYDKGGHQVVVWLQNGEGDNAYEVVWDIKNGKVKNKFEK